MSKPYLMRMASRDDLEVVMGLLDSRIRWLEERGFDQWNKGRAFRPRVAESIERGETWLLSDDSDPIATITLGTVGDPDFWTPAERDDKAIYVGKMASKIDRRGEGLGALMLRWAEDEAARSGVSLIRWDVWRTNPQLQDYYRSLGARHVRTVEVAGRWSGVLFEVPAREHEDLRSEVVTP
jgi:GNAT superfamily N-acetyltransferase